MYSSHVYDENEIELCSPAPSHPVNRRLLLSCLAGGAALAVLHVGVLQPLLTARRSAVTNRVQPLPSSLQAAPRTATAGATDLAEWAPFRNRFITAEGRVVDTGNGGVSHSEGQGYGMLLAAWADDRATFERLLGWTQANLSRPKDALHAWRWQPGLPNPVPDTNSATDGDIMIAWALLRAGERWNMPAWHKAGLAIADDLLRLSTREAAGRLFLAPGAHGFDRTGRIVVNPSYSILPAMRAFAEASGDPRWTRLDRDSLWLIDRARFGANGLTPDWVEIDLSTGAIRLAEGWLERFSWDAIRVPLYLGWAGETASAGVQAPVRFWNIRKQGLPIAWIDLRSGELAPYRGHSGVQAVAELATALVAADGTPPALPAQAAAPDYYAAALSMLARMAWQEHPRPVSGAVS